MTVSGKLRLFPPLSAYTSEEIANGIAFMQGLVRHAEAGEQSEHDLGSGARLRVLRRR